MNMIKKLLDKDISNNDTLVEAVNFVKRLAHYRALMISKEEYGIDYKEDVYICSINDRIDNMCKYIKDNLKRFYELTKLEKFKFDNERHVINFVMNGRSSVELDKRYDINIYEYDSNSEVLEYEFGFID